jgi:hypothetical protein
MAVPQAPSMMVEETLSFSPGDLSLEKLDGYDVVRLAGCDFLNEAGKPWLPSRQVRVALPAGMVAESVRVEWTANEELDGQFNIFPAQPPRRTSRVESQAPFCGQDPAVYASRRAYPETLAVLVGQTDLAGQGMAVIRIYPVQYFPAEGSLILHTSLRLTIEGSGGYVCGDYLPAGLSTESRESLERTARGMVINPQEVALRPSDEPQTAGVPAGDYDYVIITSTSWVTNFQPLANWKTKKGTRATIVDTTWIYNSGGYSGTNVEKIRAFVVDAYNNWGAVYFLIGGDTGTVPTHSRTIDGDAIPNDTYYGDFDADWTCEVHVGRASVTSVAAITTFIDKVLTYEKEPPLTGYARKACLLGFDLDDWTEGEDGKTYIDNNYIPSTWTMTNVYDSHSGNHETNANTAVNAGQNLINHIDHADYDVLGVGSYNHGYYWSTSEVDAFTNGDRQSIMYSLGCWPAAYDYSDCIAEHFVRDTNGGGVAFVGNSRYGWYMMGDMASYSALYDRYFFASLFSQGYYRLGPCFSDHKNDGPTSDSTYQYILTCPSGWPIPRRSTA